MRGAIAEGDAALAQRPVGRLDVIHRKNDLGPQAVVGRGSVSWAWSTSVTPPASRNVISSEPNWTGRPMASR